MELQNLKAFCVETKGVCIFCLTPASKPVKNEDDPQVISHNVSLKRLSRYLNVDFRKVFNLNIPLQQYMNFGKSDVIVPLCCECATVTRKFSKLHHELELVKMHLHSCVQTIRERMTKMESRNEILEKYRKRWIMSNHIDAIQSGIVDNLRKETNDKCFLKTSTAIPRVKLKKVKISCTGNKSVTKKAPEIPSRKRVCEHQANSRNHSVIPIKKQTPLLNQPTSTPKTTKNSYEIEKGPPESQKPKQSTLSISNPTTETNQANITNSWGELRPNHVSSVQHLQSSTLSQTGSCIKTIGQKTGKTNDKPAHKLNQKSTSYDCVYCEEIFNDKSTLRTHVVRSHCEQYFTTLKDPKLSSEEFKNIVTVLFKNVVNANSLTKNASYSCPYCNTKQESDGDVYAHMFRFHYSDLTSKLLELQKSKLSSSSSMAISTTPASAETNQRTKLLLSFSCDCGMLYASKRTLDFHQKYNCKNKDKNQLNDPCTINSDKHANLVPTNSSPILHQFPSTSKSASKIALKKKIGKNSAEEATKFKCAYCTKSFPFYYDHRVHVLTSHQMEEFSKYVPSGVSAEHVENELQRILKIYRKLPGNDMAGGCLFCSEVFSKVEDLQNHILVSHFDVVVYKLRSMVPEQRKAVLVQRPDIVLPAENTQSPHVELLSPIVVESSNDQLGGTVTVPLKQDANSSNPPDSVEIIMQQDPLSFDFLEFDPATIIYQDADEEQLKMEWLFSFFDEDGSPEVQTQSQQVVEDAKGFLGNDGELILP